MRSVAGVVLLWCLLISSGCGKKGPPLPPLLRLPAAPQDLVATRQGARVSLRFRVPAGNTDGGTPADVTRVEVYALTGVSTLTPDDLIRRGVRVGSVAVNPPKEPDVPEDADAPSGDIPRETPVNGVDQGAAAGVTETIEIVDGRSSELRSYIAFGINKRGRRGAFSTRALVPMSEAPAPPPPPTLTYDEVSVAVSWSEAPAAGSAEPIGYLVYAVGATDVRLTEAPVQALRVVEPRIEWHVERCYVVRTVATVESLTIESESSAPACVTPEDTFPPSAPSGLNTVPETGAVNLIWSPNEEPDLAGYFVLRAIAPATTPVALNAVALQDTTFRDTVPSGSRVTYAIQAVDKAGNVSAASARADETAR